MPTSNQDKGYVKMKKLIALVAVLFSVVVPVQSQAAESKALVIIDSYFDTRVTPDAITPQGTPCKVSAPVKNASSSDPYNHGNSMYAVAKLQDPSLKIIAVCGASATTEMTPAMFITAMNWVKANSSKIAAVSFSRYFNHASKPCMPTASAPWTPETADKEIRNTIASLKSQGILVFASSGNAKNAAVTYPGCIADITAVAHADDKGNPLAWSDANTDYFVKLTDDGSKWAYSTQLFGLVAHSSSSATAAVAAMWTTTRVAPGIVKPKI
jgi:hypothetical protein